MEKPVCFVWMQQVPVPKEYDIQCHYDTHHGKKYNCLQKQLRRERKKELWGKNSTPAAKRLVMQQLHIKDILTGEFFKTYMLKAVANISLFWMQLVRALTF